MTYFINEIIHCQELYIHLRCRPIVNVKSFFNTVEFSDIIPVYFKIWDYYILNKNDSFHIQGLTSIIWANFQNSELGTCQSEINTDVSPASLACTLIILIIHNIITTTMFLSVWSQKRKNELLSLVKFIPRVMSTLHSISLVIAYHWKHFKGCSHCTVAIVIFTTTIGLFI